MSLARLLTRFVLPALIIVALGLFLALRDRDRVLYELPQLEPFAVAEVDRLEISRASLGVAVNRTGDGWVTEPGEFPADRVQVRAMLEALAQIRVTDLISQYGAYGRFELDPEAALRVTAYRGEQVVRTIEIGKRAGTFQHTYVKLAGDRRVYQAKGDLQETFPFGLDALRDKVVLSFDAASVNAIVSRTPEEMLALQRQPAAAADAAAEWATTGGGAWDSAAVEESVQRLANLTTFRFAESAPGGEPELLLLTLTTTGGDTHELRVFARQDNSHPATSSGSAYPFLLFPWMVNGFLDAFTTAGAPAAEPAAN